MKITVSPGERWYPQGTRYSYRPPAVGDYIAWNHSAWRVVEVRPVPEDRWTDYDRERVASYKPASRDHALPVHVVVRPAHLGDDVLDRSHDKHLRHRAGIQWDVYPDEHYPVCACCHEPMPCREKLGQRIAEHAIKKMSRYESAGVCPSCSEPVTQRQKALTFTENLEIPGGPPVTFHVGRRSCRYAAAGYEKRWVAADPNRRKVTLSCSGHVTNHGDGTYDCTQLAECPGPAAFHQSYQVCRDRPCWANGNPGCHPAPTARRNEGEVTA